MPDTRESRIIIADMVKDVWNFFYGPASIAKPAWMTTFEATRTDITFGSWDTSAVFRHVRRGLWEGPGEVKASRVTVVDGGERRDDSDDHTNGEFRLLTIQTVLDLKDNFKRDGALDVWIERISAVKRYLHLVQGTDANIITINFVDDKPFEVATGDGASSMHWFIEHEINYAEFAP